MIAEYAPDTDGAVLGLLGLGAGTSAVPPREATIRRLLQRLDPDAAEAALNA